MGIVAKVIVHLVLQNVKEFVKIDVQECVEEDVVVDVQELALEDVQVVVTVATDV